MRLNKGNHIETFCVCVCVFFRVAWICQFGRAVSNVKVLPSILTRLWQFDSRGGHATKKGNKWVCNLPVYLGSCLVIACCDFYMHIMTFCHSTTNRHALKLVRFQSTLKMNGWYLNTSVVTVITYPTVIYLRLFGLSVFGARDKEKTTRSGLCMDHRWTLGPLSVCRILPLNETFCFPNLVK